MPLSNKLRELVDRISSQREKLLASISGLNEAQLNYKAGEAAWSVSDVLNHVALADAANAKLQSNLLKRARAENLPADASPEGSMIGSMDEVLPQLNGAKFQAPEFLAPHSHAPVAESLASLTASRMSMLESVGQLDGYDLSTLTYPHPFAGALNAYQWILMAGFHEFRHTAQIERMKAEPGFPN